MPDYNQIKTQLVHDLWFPTIKNGGDVLYPRLRKNKQMKIFTLTTDTNFEEITTLMSSKLTQKERIIAWTQSQFKQFRLETNISLYIVFGGTTHLRQIQTNIHIGQAPYV